MDKHDQISVILSSFNHFVEEIRVIGISYVSYVDQMFCIKELGSAQLFIEILQKGSNMSTASEFVSNNIPTTLHEELYHEVNNNWKLVISGQSSGPKKLTEHVIVPNSQMFATSNWYSILVGLKETDRSGKKSTKQWNKKHLT